MKTLIRFITKSILYLIIGICSIPLYFYIFFFSLMESIIEWSDKDNNQPFREIFKEEWNDSNMLGSPKEWLK